LTFHVPKELNLLPPRPDEMLIGSKTNKFGDVTCMKYKKTTPCVTLDGVRAMPEQIKVVPPKKRPSSSSKPSEPKHQKTTLATLEKKMEELEQKITRIHQDLAFLAGAIDRLTARMDKVTIKHKGLKSHVNIISRTIARRLEN
jgi:peptidoglycan hydrolase CwlO-like protein